MTPFRALPWLAVASSLGCLEPRSNSQTIDTLATGAVIARAGTGGLWEQQPSEAWSLSTGLTLAGSGVPLGAVDHIAFDGQGHVYVADRLNASIVVFDTLGSELRRLGRWGQGPGEFRGLGPLGVDQNGALWAADVAAFHVFAPDGNFERSVQRGNLSGGSIPWQRLLDSRGCVWEESLNPENVNERLVCHRCRLDLPPTCQAELPHAAPEFVAGSIMSRNTIAVPNSPRRLVDLDGAGNLWSLTTDRYRITKRTWGGDTLLIIEKRDQARSLSSEEKARGEELRESLEQRGFRLVNGELPEVAPVVSAFAVTDSSQVLVVPARTTDDGHRLIDVFRPDGWFLGSMATDWHGEVDRIFVTQSRELVLVVRDSAGQQIPRYYRTRRGTQGTVHRP